MLTFQNGWHERLPGPWLLILETFKFTCDFDLIAVSQQLLFASQSAGCSLRCTLRTLSNCISQLQVTGS